MLNEQRIRELAVKNGLFTPDEKKEVRKAVKELELDVNLRGGCPDCWRDAVILIAVKLGVKLGEADKGRLTAGGRYICIREGVWWRNGQRVRLTADTDERLIASLRREKGEAWGKYYADAESGLNGQKKEENGDASGQD